MLELEANGAAGAGKTWIVWVICELEGPMLTGAVFCLGGLVRYKQVPSVQKGITA